MSRSIRTLNNRKTPSQACVPVVQVLPPSSLHAIKCIFHVVVMTLILATVVVPLLAFALLGAADKLRSSYVQRVAHEPRRRLMLGEAVEGPRLGALACADIVSLAPEYPVSSFFAAASWPRQGGLVVRPLKFSITLHRLHSPNPSDSASVHLPSSVCHEI